MNVDIRPQHINLLSICTGGGGLDLGVELAIPSARTVCMVEREAFAIANLVSAMEAGLLAPAPIWSDVRTFDGRRWRGCVDGLIGGIPCQPHSIAGKKRGSIDERDLWSPTRRIIVQARVRLVLIENVGGMLSAGDDEVAGAARVIRDLRKLGFEVEAGLFTAQEVGAPHVRERIFILGLADTGSEGLQGGEFVRSHGEWEGKEAYRPASELCGPSLGHPNSISKLEPDYEDGSIARPNSRHSACWSGGGSIAELDDASVARSGSISVQPEQQGKSSSNLDRPSLFPPGPADTETWRSVLERSPHLEPSVRRMADGMASHVDELRMLGNGVLPLEAAYALRTLAARIAARSPARASFLIRAMGTEIE
ncbi:DNA cytosine methyltransferase [Rhizobium sp. AB2/73]|uniref:DNA cytosine methyltransferase n=1 Tax=Rhizobium sp. AB2/73 TaxID=2795216 RepID=UPI001C5DE046|nr:DNA cytosine methyltransferase [Rhizobium sp. AB2/73]UEQ81115.1 DNA cytosine methyltransferase [Rhizobium sp. AB2/73]